MFTLKIISKELIDQGRIQANCTLFSGTTPIKENITVQATLESFEETARENGEKWARSFQKLSEIREDIEVDLLKIDNERQEMLKREKEKADLAAAVRSEAITDVGDVI